jgi:hypothetical protein
MRAKFLLAATAIALLAGTAVASAQSNIRIQSRDFRSSNGITSNHHWRGGYYGGYGAYDAVPGGYGYDVAPGFYVGPRYGYHRHWRHW